MIAQTVPNPEGGGEPPPTLERMIELAQAILVVPTFARGKRIHPVWAAMTADGTMAFVQPEQMRDDAEKDKVIAEVRRVFKEVGATQYCHVTEAWMAVQTIEPGKPVSRSSFPKSLEFAEGRIECVYYVAEDIAGRQVCARQEIARPIIGEPYLKPMVWMADYGMMKGRFVGLLREPRPDDERIDPDDMTGVNKGRKRR